MKGVKSKKTITRTLRISESLDNQINDYCINNNIKFPDLIRELISKKINYNYDNDTIKVEQKKENESKEFHLKIKSDEYQKLLLIAESKNVNVSHEIRFRLSSSLSLPAFDSLELREIDKARIEISRIGGLLKYATMKGLLLNDELSNKLTSEIENLKKVFLKLYIDSSKRIM